jgi:hypothetical protein
MNKRSIWGITGHSHASNGMSLAAEVVAKKKEAPVGESGLRTHNRACPTKPEKKLQPDCPCDALKF